MKRLWTFFVLGWALVVLTAACGGGSDDGAAETASGDEVAATAAPEPPPTEEPEPPATPEPEPTATPEPTPTPEPTATPEPTPTPEPPYAVNRDMRTDGAETSLRATSSGQLPTTVYDRFVPKLDGPIATVSWQGAYTFCFIEDTEALPHATAFELGLHSDIEGEPDLNGALFSTTVSIEEANQTMLSENVNQPCQGQTDPSIWSWYGYDVELADGPVVSEGEPVWMSIRAVAPNYEPFWGWRSSLGGPVPSRQFFNGSTKIVTTGARQLTVLVDPQ